jgi:hypothetical protein
MVTLKLRCIKKSIIEHFTKKADGSQVLNTSIELYLAYSNDPKNPNYPFSEMSGGSTFLLQTVNEDAANVFNIGKNYDIEITPAND